MESIIATNSAAAKDFRKGMTAALEARTIAENAKNRMLDAGLFFLSAQSTARAGEFLELIAAHQATISQRSVYNAINFAKGALADAANQKPELGGRQLELFAKQAVLKTPKNFTALMRDWGFIKDGARYDKDDYRQRKALKLKNGGALHQREFHSEVFQRELDDLLHAQNVETLSAREIKKLINALTDKQAPVLARLYALLPNAHEEGAIDV